MRIKRNSKLQAGSRRGLATVELAVCLPVLVILVFGSIEASSYIFLKQSLNAAAYEGIREAVRVGVGNANAEDRVNNILNARGVTGFNVNFPGGNVADLSRGEEFAIEVSAPTATNSPLVGQFIPNRILTARVVMVKE
jgi:hypothetical protein